MYWNDDWLRQSIERLLHDIQANFTEDYLKKTAKQMATGDKVDALLPKSLMKGVRNDSLAFVESVKSCIDEVGSDAEDETTRKDLQDFCRLPLAYWMRSMLKKQDPVKVFQTYSEYLWKMFYSVYYFHKFDREICNFEIGDVDVYNSDIRQLSRIEDSRLTNGEIDGIITSPPYGTAIDYIGDHVWALYVLGVTKDHLKLDDEFQIGSSRKSDVAEIIEKSEAFLSLPETAQRPLLDMVRNDREKKAAALYRYFVDMRTAFEQMSTVLKPGKKLVMIIGKQQSVNTQNGTVTLELGAAMEEIGKNKPAALEHLYSIDIELQKASERGAIPTEHVIFFKKA
jgi:hypothetical protein